MRKIKRGTKGEATQYLTRSNAIRAMQVSLSDFRKLCILKGIYPREPRKKFKGNTKTYFHVKDLKILQHDQMLDKFRSIKAHLKKHKRLLGRREVKQAETHMKKTPKYNLAPVIKDRYPTFVDALRDLDDALCLVSLFAQLPQHLTLDIKKDDLVTCQRLFKDFMLYCSLSQSITKSFMSIKGMYYRVEIMGVQVTWIVPYKFNTKMPFDVDYKVMGTFLEFYKALVKFVNYKLFSDLGFSYPFAEGQYPQVASGSASGTYLDCKVVRDWQANVRKMFEDNDEANEVDPAFANSPEMIKLRNRQEAARKQRRLFDGSLFLLSREVPTYILQYLLLSFGGDFVVQDDLPEDEAEAAKILKRVTHICMDRPLPVGEQPAKGKEYVQPQYIVDCINNLFLLPTKPYLPGVAAPAHLSPFIDNVAEGYMPDRQREINALAGVDEQEMIGGLHLKTTGAIAADSSDDDSEAPKEGDSPAVDDAESDQEGGAAGNAGKGDLDSSSDEEGGSGDDSSDEEEEAAKPAKRTTRQAAEKRTAKAISKPEVLTKTEKQKKNDKLKRDLKKEQEELGKMLMTNRQKKMF